MVEGYCSWLRKFLCFVIWEYLKQVIYRGQSGGGTYVFRKFLEDIVQVLVHSNTNFSFFSKIQIHA